MASTTDEKSLQFQMVTGLIVFSGAIAAGLWIWKGTDDSEDEAEIPISVAVPEVVSFSRTETALPIDEETASLENGRNASPSRQSRGGPTEEPVRNPVTPDASETLAQNDGEVSAAIRNEMRSVADSSASQAQKVSKFKAYLDSQSDPATQKLAMRHLSKLVEDDQYNEYLAEELLDPNQSDLVRAALVQDINARNRQVMLPVMVEIMEQPDHPLKDLAQQTLGRYLGDSYSDDPDTLRSSVKEYMRRRSDDF